MARRNRETLKNYFRQGKRPSEQEFEDLIDSTLNTLDDGYSGSPQTGLGLTPQTQQGTVISVFRNPEDTKAIWEIGVDKQKGDLHIRQQGEGKDSVPVAIFSYAPTLLSNTPEMTFDGVVNSKGRKGIFKTGAVPADGKWHDMFSDEDRMQPGCWAFEIVAGCGERQQGRYALVVANALQCFGGKPKVHTVQSYFGQRGNKIKIRWKIIKGEHNASLQIKTNFYYDSGVEIHYQIGSLWDNPFMQL